MDIFCFAPGWRNLFKTLIFCLLSAGSLVLDLDLSVAAENATTGNRTESSSDPYQLIHHTIQHTACTLDNKFMECVKKCRRMRRVEDGAWPGLKEKENYNINRTKMIMQESIKAGMDPFSCFVRCRTNPELQICRSNCDTSSFSNFNSCRGICDKPSPSFPFVFSATAQPNYTSAQSECRSCINHELNQGALCQDSYKGRRTRCLETIEECAANPAVLLLKLFIECVSIRLLEKDFEYWEDPEDSQRVGPCFDDTKSRIESAECDKFMHQFLGELEMCKSLCEDGVEMQPFDKCVLDCDANGVEEQQGQNSTTTTTSPESSILDDPEKLAAIAECKYACVERFFVPCVYDPPEVLDLTSPYRCKWVVDFSLSSAPLQLTSLYFNEKGGYDMKDKLLHPNSHQFLTETEISGSKGFFVMPYFVIVRGICDGDYYSDEIYKMYQNGGYPTVKLQFWPLNHDDRLHELFRGDFRGALVNLTRNVDDVLVPSHGSKSFALLSNNTNNSIVSQDTKKAVECHWEICYPGYAVPLLMYQATKFDVTIDAIEEFEQLKIIVYTSVYHSRDSRIASLIVTNAAIDSSLIVLPKMFFPSNRIQPFADPELLAISQAEFAPDILINSYGGESTEPLDGEDFFMPQFSFGAANMVVIGGFYDASLLIFMDPDMSKLELATWSLNDAEADIAVFSGKNSNSTYRCMQNIKAGGIEKVMYSQYSRDTTFQFNNYRTRMEPKLNGEGRIYEVISMKDRLLLVTARGLITFYGNMNSTVAGNKMFRAPSDERRAECFKFVRIAQRTSSFEELVIGVTYDYKKGEGENVNQQIWVGELIQAGQAIKWEQLESATPAPDDGIKMDGKDSGKLAVLSQRKHGGGSVPFRKLETTAVSEVERICLQAYKELIHPYNRETVILERKTAWCEAIDATPDLMKRRTFLFMVQMYVKYVGIVSQDQSKLKGTDPRVFFYIIASHTLRANEEEKVSWKIVNIIPRIPCAVAHKESIRNVYMFDSDYFTLKDTSIEGKTVVGCHNLRKDDYEEFIYLTRLVVTRIISPTVFVFGSRLLQSTDSGNTFLNLNSFPADDNQLVTLQDRLKHRIEVMAFDESGRYSFLTSRKELWIGTSGDVKQIRIRPSPGYSLTQKIALSDQKGLYDATPFSLLFDHNGKLFELVAVRDAEGEIDKIMRRPVDIAKILRVNFFNQKLKSKGDALGDASATPSPTTPDSEYITFDATEWHLYCPFNSPELHENYSELYSRTQVFYFPPPVQHPSFGRAYQNPALWAFEVATFSITYKSLYELHYDTYPNKTSPDPLTRWIQQKEETARIGILKFGGNKDENGVLVIPGKYKRSLKSVYTGRIFKTYYLDYGAAVYLTFKFSVKNDATIGYTIFQTQKVSQIQMNIDNSNGSLIRVETEKRVLPTEAAVEFVVKLSVIRSVVLKQNHPGKNLIDSHVVFHLIGAFGKCFPTKADPIASDSFETLLRVGCRPSWDLVFNWDRSLNSITFRGPAGYMGRGSDCYNDAFVCFFARVPMQFHFDVFDITKQRYIPYNGKFKMRVVAGGYSANNMTTYTLEEQDAYNIQGVSDVSLIWNEWDKLQEKKKDKLPPNYDGSAQGGVALSRETVLQAGVSYVQWACHTLSPCARVLPNWNLQTVYFFKLFVTNRDVENNTLCLFEKEFVIMLYGFPPSPETQLITTIVFSLCLLGIIYLMFVCCRAHKRVWRTTKVKVYGWYQIVRDTFPKTLKTHEDQPRDEHTQRQKDKIILSLQGHLKIPKLVARGSATSVELRDERASVTSHTSSASSLKSRTSTLSTLSQGSVMEPSSSSSRAPAPGPANWTDMVYEQIISKRLTAIVEKNKKLRSRILEKSGALDASAHTEMKYEQKHKQTIKEELDQVKKPPPPEK